MEKLTNILLTLVSEYGFFKEEDGRLSLIRGSIANYRKIYIREAEKIYPVCDGEKVLAFPVEFEEFSENGSTADHHTKMFFYVEIDNIFEWLKSKGYQSATERAKEDEENRRRWKQKQREFAERKLA